MSIQVATANRLDDGRVIYLTPEGEWSTDIDDSRVAEHPDAIAELEYESKAAEKAAMIVGPYLVDVDVRRGRVMPIRYRERIRAFGPSVPGVGETLLAQAS